MASKPIIYQVFPRWYGNRNTTRKENGTISENGCGKFADFTPKVLKQLRELGVSHIWYTGIIRHATQTDYSAYGIPRQHPAIVKGQAGSPYAITDYYDVCPDLAVNVEKRMEEFEKLVNRTHRAGLKVVIDFVPNHVARQYHSIAKPKVIRDLGEDDDPQQGFSRQNNFYYCPGQPFMPHFDFYQGEIEPYTEMPAKATGNDNFSNAPGRNDWYETVKLNYGVDYYAGQSPTNIPFTSTPSQLSNPSTFQKMLDILLFWAAKGVDAFRCDMVFMVPVAFWQWAIPQVREKFPHITFIGEIYDPALYHDFIAAGFDWLYDKVGMYDCLRDVICHHRRTADITFQWQSLDDIRNHMLYFLENHDEQRIGSDFFAADGYKAIPALIVCALLGNNPLMVYAGEEYGEHGMDKEGFSGHDGRTTIFDYWAPDTLCRAMAGELTTSEQELYEIHRRVLNIARQEKTVCEGLMFDLMYVNQHLANQQYAFLRKNRKELLLVVANFSNEMVSTDINIPLHAFEYMQIPEGTMTTKDLLTNEAITLQLTPNTPIHIELPSRGARVLLGKW